MVLTSSDQPETGAWQSKTKWDWASWKYRRARCTPDIHTDKAVLTQFRSWLTRIRTSLTDTPMGRENGLMVTLAIAMVVKDVEKKTEHRSDEEAEIPQYVHKSQLTYSFVKELGEHCTEIADLWSDMAYRTQKKRKADGEPEKSSAIGARAKRVKPNVSASPAPGKRSAKSTKATRSSTRRR